MTIDLEKLTPNQRHDLEHEVTNRFERDFNQINFDNWKAAEGVDYCEEIALPKDETRAKEWLEDLTADEQQAKEAEYKEDGADEDGAVTDYYDWLWDNYQNEIQEWWDEREWYPMWSTIFEARDSFLSEWIVDHVDELYQIGIGVILPTDCWSACLFIAGAGYSFYDSHWIPMYVDLLEWVKIPEEEVINHE